MFIRRKTGPKLYAVIGTNAWWNDISLIISNIVAKGKMALESVVKYNKYRKIAKNR